MEVGSIAFAGGGGFGGFGNGANGGNGGLGGFGGGGGAGGHGGLVGSPGLPGAGGFAAADGSDRFGGSGAGLGGAIFLKAGRLRMNGCRFRLNQAIGGLGMLGGQGKGGALFVISQLIDDQNVEVGSQFQSSECIWIDNFASSSRGIQADNHHFCIYTDPSNRT